jgi:hypothetical protein
VTERQRDHEGDMETDIYSICLREHLFIDVGGLLELFWTDKKNTKHRNRTATDKGTIDNKEI